MRSSSCIRASDFEAAGAMTALLKDAFAPNLVQTIENNPALIHGGPFANIAHGCNSVIATKSALKLADYVVTEAENALLKSLCEKLEVESITADHWAKGGEGAVELAEAVVKTIETNPSQFRPLYDDNIPLWKKAQTIAREVYGADDIIGDQKIRDRFRDLQDQGYGHLPVCIAKTQYSFTTDPDRKGAPKNHVVPIREVRLSAGAEFIVAICGDIMTMPGLPKVPAANKIDVTPDGRIIGLF